VEGNIYISGSVCTCAYKNETAHHYLSTLLEIPCYFWSPKIIKDDFEAAVISEIKKSFQTPLLLAVIFILANVCEDKYKILVKYKDSEQARLTCRMCAALAFFLIGKVGCWFIIMQNAPQNDKLTVFFDYYVQQLMENQNVPIEMWNVQSGSGIST
jgi:hypothetical protein